MFASPRFSLPAALAALGLLAIAALGCEPRGPAGGQKEKAAPAPPARTAFTLQGPERRYRIEPADGGYRIVAPAGRDTPPSLRSGTIGRVRVLSNHIKVRIDNKTVARAKTRRAGFKLAVGAETRAMGKVGRKAVELVRDGVVVATWPRGAGGPALRDTALKATGFGHWERLAMAVWLDELVSGRRTGRVAGD